MTIPYPLTYQRELSPAWLNYAAVLGGDAARDLRAPFRYLELGCGRGYSALVHALANRHGEFLAVDRDTRAIAQARAWARDCGVANLRFEAVSFDALLLEGRFDFIALHGVYSWVDAATQARLRDLLGAHLAPGGLAYVSYNCLPGRAGEVPLHRLLGEASADGDIASGARLVETLRAAGASYFTAHPTADRAVASWAAQPDGYLAQEYLAEASQPLWSADVMADMAQAGLAFAGSATLHDQHEALLIDDAAARAIAALPSPRLRTLAMDFAVNRGFRRDLYGRLPAARDAGGLDRVLIGCPDGACAIAEAITVPRGRITFRADFIAALRRLMANGPLPLGEAVAALGDPAAARNLLWLVAAGALIPVGPGSESAARETLRQRGIVASA